MENTEKSEMGAMQSLSENSRNLLREIARQSITHGLEHGVPLAINAKNFPPELQRVQSSFVTLMLQHELRGCIGGLEARMPLIEDVALHAFQAAFRDPRFSPLTPEEFSQLEISISILNPAEALLTMPEAELLRTLRPGQDGLILEDGNRYGTFLPSVWESLRTPEEFLNHLKRKAGLPMDYWSPTLRFSRYTVESIPHRSTSTQADPTPKRDTKASP